MSKIWKIHKRLRHLLPQFIIKKIRFLVERYFDSFWATKSFSIAGEDLALQSLLFRRDQQVGASSLRPNGFFVDIGAFAPKQFSNTYLFYKKGWSGINIDATPNSMTIFNKTRKRDINIEIAVSDTQSVLDYYTWGTPTVVNTLSLEHAEIFTKRLGIAPQIVKVQTRTLESILDEFLPKGQFIDFMNVDVENHDLNVLTSNNWDKYRPFLVAVELAIERFDQILNSEITTFMQSKNYYIASWIYPNIIFESNT